MQAKRLKAMVQAYNPRSGKHFLVYADGDVEWIAMGRGYYAWHALSANTEAELRLQISSTVNARKREEARLPGLPLGVTPEGGRLFGPEPVCCSCHAPAHKGGALHTCSRCAKQYHLGCQDSPGAALVGATVDDAWVCGQCSRCDACGAGELVARSLQLATCTLSPAACSLYFVDL